MSNLKPCCPDCGCVLVIERTVREHETAYNGIDHVRVRRCPGCDTRYLTSQRPEQVLRVLSTPK